MKASLLIKGFPKLGNVYRYFDKDYVVSMIYGSYRYGVRWFCFPVNITKRDYLNGLRLYNINSSDDYSFVRRETNFSNFKYECKKHLKYFIDCVGLHAVLREKQINENSTYITYIIIDSIYIRIGCEYRNVKTDKKVIPNIELVKKALEYNMNYITEHFYHNDIKLMRLTLDELIEDYFFYCKNINSNSKKTYIYKYEIYKRLIEQL